MSNNELEGRIVWEYVPQRLTKTEQVYFTLHPDGKLRDLNFHEINNDNAWKNMGNNGDYVALLQVAAETNASQIKNALRILMKKGNYKTVEIYIVEKM